MNIETIRRRTTSRYLTALLAAIVAVGILAVRPSGAADAHAISCTLTAKVPQQLSWSETIDGSVYRSCSDNVDVSSTTAQVQYKSGGVWYDYGAGSTTSNTNASFLWTDSPRCWPEGTFNSYRTEGAMDVFHGTWTSFYKTSDTLYEDC